MTTRAAGGIRFGGSGFGPEYISNRKRRVEHLKDERSSSAGQNLLQRRPEEEKEVFLFTVKDPIRSALAQLMGLIKVTLVESPSQAEKSPEVISGPMGYTSVKAVRPISYAPTKSIFRPVVR